MLNAVHSIPTFPTKLFHEPAQTLLQNPYASPSRQIGFFLTMDRLTLWPNRSRMLLMPYRIMVGLQRMGHRASEFEGLKGI